MYCFLTNHVILFYIKVHYQCTCCTDYIILVCKSSTQCNVLERLMQGMHHQVKTIWRLLFADRPGTHCYILVTQDWLHIVFRIRVQLLVSTKEILYGKHQVTPHSLLQG